MIGGVRELPSGTVTFLVTDIEGSTRLLHELGDAYADALAEHRLVLRDAFERHPAGDYELELRPARAGGAGGLSAAGRLCGLSLENAVEEALGG